MNKSISVILTVIFSLQLVGLATAQPGNTYEISSEDLYDRIYASWLGQMVGNIYGLPHENAYIEEPGPSDFPYGYGENLEQIKRVNGAFSDDDTDFEYIYLREMLKRGQEPSYSDLTNAWIYHIRNRVWLANRAALGAMHYGFLPPATGSKKYNPHWFQIDPQLVNEIWGVTAPGMPKYASQKSAWAARITNDGWGIEPTIHYGAMFAMAFFEDDLNKLIEAGNEALPNNSRFVKTVRHMQELYQKYPDDWRKARSEMANRYYHNEPEETKTIWNANLNGACGILALLYGNGDFQKTLDLASAMGFDADNQAATMSGLLGVMNGSDSIPHNLLYPLGDGEWERPFNDSYKNVTRYDMPDAKITEMAEASAEIAKKIILQNGGKKLNRNGKTYYVINSRANFEPMLEFSGNPLPDMEISKEVEFEFITSIKGSELKWDIIKGELPEGTKFEKGILKGTPKKAGNYPVSVKITKGDQTVIETVELEVDSRNIAPAASQIISNVVRTDTAFRNNMWISVSTSLFADDVSVINDGKVRGDRSVFYSIDGKGVPKDDYYGYRWDKAYTINKLEVHIGSMEENSGWFETLRVQYLSSDGQWMPVEKERIDPVLIPGSLPFNKPHFVSYSLSFKPIKTHGIRIIGKAGNSEHWYSKPSYFTSITELEVYTDTQ